MPAFDRSSPGLGGPCDRGAGAGDRLRARQQRPRVLARARRGLPGRLAAEAAGPGRPCCRRPRARLRDGPRRAAQARSPAEAHPRHVGLGRRPVRAGDLPRAEAARARGGGAVAAARRRGGAQHVERAAGCARLGASTCDRNRARDAAGMRARGGLVASVARRSGPPRDRGLRPRIPRGECGHVERVRLAPTAGCDSRPPRGARRPEWDSSKKGSSEAKGCSVCTPP